MRDARTQNVLVPEDVRQAVDRPAGDARAAYLFDPLVHGSLAELLLEDPDQSWSRLARRSRSLVTFKLFT